MLSSYKNLGSFTLSLLTCAVLLGCHTEKDSYKGPVQGTTKIAKNVESAKTDANQKQHNSAKINSTHFGEDQRFASQVIDVTKNQRYKSSPAYEYNFGELVVNGKPDYANLGQPEQTDASAVNIVQINGWLRYPRITAKDENKKFRPGDRAEFFMASQSFLIFQSRSPRINGIAERSELSATGRVYSMNRSVIRFEYLPSSLGIPPFAIKSLSAAVSEDENLTTA